MTNETKTDPPRTSGEDHARVTAETVVTDGPSGLARLAETMRKILKTPKSPSTKAPRGSA